MKTKRPSSFSFFINAVIDLGLICMGALLYYHFMIKPFGPIDLQPAVIQVFGGDRQLAVLVISGLPFIVGLLGLVRYHLQNTARRETTNYKVIETGLSLVVLSGTKNP